MIEEMILQKKFEQKKFEHKFFDEIFLFKPVFEEMILQP